MIHMTKSLRHWLWENNREALTLISFGHTELMTDEMWEQYYAWCETDEAKPYLSEEE